MENHIFNLEYLVLCLRHVIRAHFGIIFVCNLLDFLLIYHVVSRWGMEGQNDIWWPMRQHGVFIIWISSAFFFGLICLLCCSL